MSLNMNAYYLSSAVTLAGNHPNIRNGGDPGSTFVVNSVTITGPDAGSYSCVPACNDASFTNVTMTSPGPRLDIPIRFTPPGISGPAYTATLNINTSLGVYPIPLSGTGLDPFGINMLDYGIIRVGSSTVKTLHITNAASTIIPLGTIGFPKFPAVYTCIDGVGSDSQTYPCNALLVPASGWLDVKVRFTPTYVQEYKDAPTFTLAPTLTTSLTGWGAVGKVKVCETGLPCDL
jgi:hypothetical protein